MMEQNDFIYFNDNIDHSIMIHLDFCISSQEE